MLYFIDYHPDTDFRQALAVNNQFTLRSIDKIEDLAFMIHYTFDVNMDTVLESVARLLLMHKDVIFVGNPSVFDKIQLPETSKFLGEALMTVYFYNTHSLDTLRSEIENETENGVFVLVVREVYILDDSVRFTYTYGRRSDMNLDGAIRRCTIDEVLKEL